ncbi:hypothetical protein JTB14_004228 [Gonioctena quinquepunctata]|nr:hypothetical protein JTB14_004228 [Gonioctena quinquepunctata]
MHLFGQQTVANSLSRRGLVRNKKSLTFWSARLQSPPERMSHFSWSTHKTEQLKKKTLAQSDGTTTQDLQFAEPHEHSVAYVSPILR